MTELSVENKAYYEDLLDLFTDRGWSTFIEDMQEGADQVTLDSCRTTEEFLIAKGKKAVYDRLLGYETFIKDGYDAQTV